MSHDGQNDERESDRAVGFDVCTFQMPAGTVFDWHRHHHHQLAWASSGVLTVRSGVEAWVLPPSRALWIPAGVRHETLSEGVATMRTAYVRTSSCSIAWTACTPVDASQLVAQLLGFLENDDLEASHRVHAEQLLVDLLRPVASYSFQVRMPRDDRALRVATLLVDNPADDRTLATWGLDVGASSRTLARAFIADTGLPFARWRTLVRLQRAMEALGSNEPVADVARTVGYESASAFVAAFRRETGITPAKYFHEKSVTA
jgi:AraC-like DNA-binding protein/mannose-6-phosphate isomerase-like protein (cupin superfamily)